VVAISTPGEAEHAGCILRQIRLTLNRRQRVGATTLAKLLSRARCFWSYDHHIPPASVRLSPSAKPCDLTVYACFWVSVRPHRKHFDDHTPQSLRRTIRKEAGVINRLDASKLLDDVNNRRVVHWQIATVRLRRSRTPAYTDIPEKDCWTIEFDQGHLRHLLDKASWQSALRPSQGSPETRIHL